MRRLRRARDEEWAAGPLEYALACVAAAVNETDRALAHLAAARDAGWDDPVLARNDPALGSLTDLPAFKALID